MASSPDTPPASKPVRPGADPENPIAPQLENVLRNLNVNLEDELTRYRRQRHGRVPPPPPPRRARQRQTLDLISVSAESPAAKGPAASPAIPPPPPPNPFLKQTAATDDDLPEVDLSSEVGAPEPLMESEEISVASAAPSETADSALPVPSTDTPADSYLESSEELLKSLDDQATDPASVPEPYSPKRKNNTLLKLAGLFLVVLGGIGAGVVINNPEQLQSLRSRFSSTTTDSTPDEAETATPAEAPNAPAAEPASEDFDPPGPDLSQSEFVELDLESLSTLELDKTNPGNVGAIPSVPGQTAAPTQLPNPAATVPAEPVQPAQPTVPQKTETPELAPTVATGSNFYVVTSYSGDPSLDRAREFVPDAFVRNFKNGARIQLAAFDNRAQAEDQVAFLTTQGMTVELFGPTNE